MFQATATGRRRRVSWQHEFGQIGVTRVLYGSDGAAGGNLAPGEAWTAFRQLPLSHAEFHSIANHIAPYVRRLIPTPATPPITSSFERFQQIGESAFRSRITDMK